MHDTPHPSEENPNPDEVPLENLIAELTAVDPADGPDIADRIAVRLEADLAAESDRTRPAQVARETN